MRIVITGANGFVGASLCRYFSLRGHEILATGRQFHPNPSLLKFADYFRCDITNAFNFFNADMCIHAAGLASEHEKKELLNRVNITGTQNILNASYNCKAFVYISSSSVYDFKEFAAKETDSLLTNRLSNYGRSKLKAEEVIVNTHDNISHKLILRPRAIYGIGDRILLPQIFKLVKGKSILCPVTASVKTSITNVLNIANAIDLFIQQKEKPPVQTYNICDNEIYHLRNLIMNILQSFYSNKLQPFYFSKNVIKTLIKINSILHVTKQLGPLSGKAMTQNCILDTSKIRDQLNFRGIYNFDNSIEALKSWINNMGGPSGYLQHLTDVPWLNQ